MNYELNQISLDNYGCVYILNEYIENIKSAKDYIICFSDKTKPSEIMKYLKEDKLVILTGDFLKSCYIMNYIHHYERELYIGYDTETKRARISRLCYIAKENSLVDITGLSPGINFREWLGDDIKDKFYLLPVRRMERILTDIKRMENGIYYDFLKSKIYIKPFVYVPSDSSVPLMFTKYTDIFKNKTVVDIGTGTGILAIFAAQSGASRVIATDINPAAVGCAENNAKKSGYGEVIEVIESNLFDNINEKFDIIIFNAPWVQGKPKNIYELAIYDDEYMILKSFISNAGENLNPGGVILLQLSDISQQTDNSLDILYNQLKLHGFDISNNFYVKRKNRMFGRIEKVYLFEIKINKIGKEII